MSHELFQNPEQLGVAALLMMDLDDLKHINDTYGHDWGDHYIQNTGRCIAEHSPPGTVCARLSGDEFRCCSTAIPAGSSCAKSWKH